MQRMGLTENVENLDVDVTQGLSNWNPVFIKSHSTAQQIPSCTRRRAASPALANCLVLDLALELARIA